MITESTWKWGLFLIVAIPLATITCSEIAEQLRKQQNPLADCFDNLRCLVIPVLAIVILLSKIFQISEQTRYLQIIETFLWLTIIYTSINFINIIFTGTTKQYRWQVAIPNLFFQTARAVLVLGIIAQILSDVWQVDLSKLLTVFGVGSLVIALALQDTLSNLVSGFLLIFESPFKVGDWITIQDIEGEVIEINWRAVRLKTRDKDIIVIPNGILGKDIICNFTLLDPTHAEKALVRFSYEDSPNSVQDLLKQTALNIEGILNDPEPDIRTKSYDDFFITYEIKFYTINYRDIDMIHNNLMTTIYYAAKRAGLTIPLPIQREYQVKYDELAPKYQVTTEQIINNLRSFSYFYLLNDDAIAKLATHVHLVNYGIGEKIMESGKLANAFYLIIRGAVKLWVNDLEGNKQEIIQLNDGDFFGETVFLHEELSYVTVTVISDLQAIAIKPEIAIDLMIKHPKLALEINYVIEERQKAVRIAKGLPPG